MVFRTCMYQHRSNKAKFNCIDVDPYGSPVPFIDAAVQAVSDGGLLMVTATDMVFISKLSLHITKIKTPSYRPFFVEMCQRLVMLNMAVCHSKARPVMKWYKKLFFPITRVLKNLSFKALRMLLKFIAASAARYGRYIHPLVSISVDFYVRIFVQVFTGKKECKATASKFSMVK